MKISVFYHHLCEAAQQRRLPLEEVLDQARSAGVEAVDLDLSQPDFDAAVELLRAHGLCVSSLYQNYERAIDPSTARRHIRCARKLGLRSILVVPGFLNEVDAQWLKTAHSRDEVWRRMSALPAVQRMKDGLSAMTAEAGEIAVTLEDYDGLFAPYATCSELTWFLREVPSLRLTLDTGNFAFWDEDVLAAWDELRDSVVHVHCKDRGAEAGFEGRQFCRGMATCAVGSGYLPMRELLERLRNAGYQGFLTIEHFGSADQLGDAIASARWLQTQL